MDVTYGVTVENAQDPFVQTAQDVMDVVAVGLSPPLWLLNPLAIGRLYFDVDNVVLTEPLSFSARSPVVDGWPDRSAWSAAVAR